MQVNKRFRYFQVNILKFQHWFAYIAFFQVEISMNNGNYSQYGVNLNFDSDFDINSEGFCDFNDLSDDDDA